MISHFSFHASVFVGSLLKRFVCRGNLPFGGRWVVGEYRKTVVATYWHHHTGASHYCVTLTPSPLLLLTHAFASFFPCLPLNLFLPPHLSHFFYLAITHTGFFLTLTPIR